MNSEVPATLSESNQYYNMQAGPIPRDQKQDRVQQFHRQIQEQRQVLQNMQLQQQQMVLYQHNLLQVPRMAA